MERKNTQLFGNGVKRTYGTEARNYNLLAARLIADLVKGFLGPRGREKMFIDILGEMTVTKDGATFLRKIDVEHPAAKVIIEASNAVDNSVGDGTTSVVVFAGALVEKAQDLLEMGISPAIISDGYHNALQMAIESISKVAIESKNYDRKIMKYLVDTCLRSKAISHFTEEMIPGLVVEGICTIANFSQSYLDIDDIKIEEKIGNSSETELVYGTVIDKTIDESSMPRIIENAKILLVESDIQDERTKTDAEIRISDPSEVTLFLKNKTRNLLQKIQCVNESGANVIFSRGGIDPLALNHFAKNGMLTVRRVKENDLLWLAKATGAIVVRDLDMISANDIGHAEKVYEKMVGDDKMVFVDGCRNPKSITFLLRASSKKILDEFHRTILDSIYILRNFIMEPKIVPGGGAVEAFIALLIKERSNLFSGKEQIVIQKFAEALEEIPLTIARNAGMNTIDIGTRLRQKIYSQSLLKDKRTWKRDYPYNNSHNWFGINAIERRIGNMMELHVLEPLMVKEQILITATEVIILLMRVDDVLMKKPVDTHGHTHIHMDGTTHSHKGGNKPHDHFDRLGKQQRPMHHYY
ncbi:MAG TPA: thermosome subunit alpha [Nitrososphaeraceae archaeon]|nr:thermosome subunit alpha [Nitrososphaeraceae archaeon]